MAKTKEDKDEVKEEKIEVKKIMPITHDFNREDMNEVRDKLNELIERQ